MRGILVFALIGLGIIGLAFHSLQSQVSNAKEAVRQVKGPPWQIMHMRPINNALLSDALGDY